MKGSSERDQTINFNFCFHWELDILYSHSLCLVSIGNLVLFELHMEPTWLKWEKTRSEVFGVDVVSWEEGWAFDFIFGSSSCSRQSYLLDYLAQGRHMQWDMGVLPIPGEWKKRQRAKQRRRRAGTKHACNFGSPYHEVSDSCHLEVSADVVPDIFVIGGEKSPSHLTHLGLHWGPELFYPWLTCLGYLGWFFAGSCSYCLTGLSRATCSLLWGGDPGPMEFLGLHWRPGFFFLWLTCLGYLGCFFAGSFNFEVNGLSRAACSWMQGGDPDPVKSLTQVSFLPRMFSLLRFVLRFVAMVFAQPYMLLILILLSMPTLAGAVRTETDVHILLSWSRRAYLEAPRVAVQVDDAGALFEEFAFVPELVLALLLSLFPNVAGLQRILRQDWITEWRGWSTSRAMLQNSADDRYSESVALERVQDVARISLQNVEVRCKSDAERRRELEAQGKIVELGLVHNNNECCADSLLQLLAQSSFVSAHLFHDVSARRRACQLCRAHLVHHVNPQLHPQQRTSTGAIADASDAEHDAAYLQHGVHAEEIVDFFVRSFPGASSVPPEGVKLQVFTRWDSPTLPAEANSVIVGRQIWADAAELGEPSLILEMFNNSGNGFTGYHYDPIF
jgi:hypothetical protein